MKNSNPNYCAVLRTEPARNPNGTIPLLINAYDKGNQKTFIIEGSETPHSVPSWVWVLLIAFLGWAAFYCLTNFSVQ